MNTRRASTTSWTISTDVTTAKPKTEPARAPERRLDPLARFAIAGGAAVVACGAFLVFAGARLNLAIFFLVGSALALALVLFLVERAARSLVDEPQEEEIRLATGRRRKELEREKQGLLRALKELEFDHEMRKISDEDYLEIKARYRVRTIRVMRQLDESSADYRRLIERDVQAHVPGIQKQSTPKPPTVETTKVRKCDCGTQNDTDADFCKKCGKRLSAEASA